MITSQFNKRRQKIGIRQLKMEIEREHGVVINHKKISRIKKEQGLETKIRKKRTKWQINQSSAHRVFPNILNREFKSEYFNEKILTDITQLNYSKDQRAYMIAYKDTYNKEIISYSVSESMEFGDIKESLEKVAKLKKDQKMLIHSDQGAQFTCRKFTKFLEKNEIDQSMSRKGNCWDNAPMESFFGLIKDHLDLDQIESLSELKKQVEKQIKYYNYEHPQIGLKKMSPVEYRRHVA